MKHTHPQTDKVKEAASDVVTVSNDVKGQCRELVCLRSLCVVACLCPPCVCVYSRVSVCADKFICKKVHPRSVSLVSTEVYLGSGREGMYVYTGGPNPWRLTSDQTSHKPPGVRLICWTTNVSLTEVMLHVRSCRCNRNWRNSKGSASVMKLKLYQYAWI